MPRHMKKKLLRRQTETTRVKLRALQDNIERMVIGPSLVVCRTYNTEPPYYTSMDVVWRDREYCISIEPLEKAPEYNQARVCGPKTDKFSRPRRTRKDLKEIDRQAARDGRPAELGEDWSNRLADGAEMLTELSDEDPTERSKK